MTADIVSSPVISLKFSFLFPGADCSNLCISSLRCGIDWVPIGNAAMSDIALSAANRKSNPGCEKSPSLIDELNEAVATGGDKERQRILERVADLFAAGARGYASDQIALFDDVLQRLSADIEVKARARLARRLAHIERAPPKLIRSLAFDDEIAVAEPLLLHSTQLSDADLVANATVKSQEHLFAIAQRLKLSEQVTDVLVERGDRRVIHKVAANKGARFSLPGYGKLTNRARRDRKLTLTLGRRSDLPRQYFLKLLETASASVRAKLEEADPQAVAAIRDMIDDVATTLQQEVRKESRRYAAALRDANRCFQCPAVHRSHHPCPRARAGVHADRDCAGEARPFPRRPGRTRAPGQRRGHDPGPRQGGRLLLDHRQGIAADVRRRTQFAAGRSGADFRAVRKAAPGDRS
jgi:hypothetical protein